MADFEASKLFGKIRFTHIFFKGFSWYDWTMYASIYIICMSKHYHLYGWNIFFHSFYHVSSSFERRELTIYIVHMHLSHENRAFLAFLFE